MSVAMFVFNPLLIFHSSFMPDNHSISFLLPHVDYQTCIHTFKHNATFDVATYRRHARVCEMFTNKMVGVLEDRRAYLDDHSPGTVLVHKYRSGKTMSAFFGVAV